MDKGIFICVEGLDGCGKTTQTRLLVKALQKRGLDAIITMEPSRRKIGRFIRNHYLDRKERGSAVVEALLFAADRFEHVEKEIVPALNKGRIIVSDRYVYSSLAYQGAAGVDLKWIEMINKLAVRPDLAVFVDTEPETVMHRLKPRRSIMENVGTQVKVREVYNTFVERGELVKINGNGSKAEVAAAILKTVLYFLKKEGWTG
jgi:dTMP kinase